VQKETEIIEIPELILDSLEDVVSQSVELGALFETISIALAEDEVEIEFADSSKLIQ
jgi:hypothetical protein